MKKMLVFTLIMGIAGFSFAQQANKPDVTKVVTKDAIEYIVKDSNGNEIAKYGFSYPDVGKQFKEPEKTQNIDKKTTTREDTYTFTINKGDANFFYEPIMIKHGDNPRIIYLWEGANVFNYEDSAVIIEIEEGIYSLVYQFMTNDLEYKISILEKIQIKQNSDTTIYFLDNEYYNKVSYILKDENNNYILPEDDNMVNYGCCFNMYSAIEEYEYEYFKYLTFYLYALDGINICGRSTSDLPAYLSDTYVSNCGPDGFTFSGSAIAATDDYIVYSADCGNITGGINQNILLESNPDSYELISIDPQHYLNTNDSLFFSVDGYWRNRHITEEEVQGAYIGSYSFLHLSSGNPVNIYSSNRETSINEEIIIHDAIGLQFYDGRPNLGEPRVHNKVLMTAQLCLNDDDQFIFDREPLISGFSPVYPPNALIDNLANSTPYFYISNMYVSEDWASDSLVLGMSGSSYGQNYEMRAADYWNSDYYIYNGETLIESNPMLTMKPGWNGEILFEYKTLNPFECRLLLTNQNYSVDEMQGYLEWETNFILDPESNVTTPPRLTTFQMVNENGDIKNTFTNEENITLRFSVFENEAWSIVLEKVALFYKTNESEEWIEVIPDEIVEMANPIYGSFFTFDFSDITQQIQTSTYFDLKLELETEDGQNLTQRWFPTFLVKNVVGLDETYDMPSVSIYPNPTNEIIKIEGNLSDNAFACIRDLSGKTVVKTQSLHTNRSIALHSLEAGIYFIEIHDKQKQEIFKFVKM